MRRKPARTSGDVIGRLKARMAELSLSVAGLGKAAADMPKSTVQSYLDGTRPFEGWGADKIAQALGVSTSWLLTGEGKRTRAYPRALTPVEARMAVLRFDETRLSAELKATRKALRVLEREYAESQQLAALSVGAKGEP